METNYNILNLDDPGAVRSLIQTIEDIVDKKIQKLLSPFVVGTVVSEAGGLLTVLLNDGSSIPLTDIKDKTKEGCTGGEEVYLLRINGSSNNMVALIQK